MFHLGTPQGLTACRSEDKGDVSHNNNNNEYLWQNNRIRKFYLQYNL